MSITARRIPSVRSLFDIPADVAFFDLAGLAPTLREGFVAGDEALRLRARPWTAGDAWPRATERRRELFAGLIGARPDDVALIAASSYGMATAAANLTAEPAQRVLVLADEYPSGIYTWRRFSERTGAAILTVRPTEGQTWTDAVLGALDSSVAVVSVPQVHWFDGALLDLEAIGAAARAVGAALVVDASQSVGAMPFDVRAVQPDFLVCVGHKWLLGPFGLGYLYVAPDRQSGTPIEENWVNRLGSEDFTRLTEYPSEYQPGARRFDMGQRAAFELTPVALTALERITEWGVPAIAETLGAITAHISGELREMGLATTEPRGPHMFGVSLPPGTQDDYVKRLAEAGVYVSARGAGLRISPYLYTTEEDVDRLLSTLRGIGERDLG